MAMLLSLIFCFNHGLFLAGNLAKGRDSDALLCFTPYHRCIVHSKICYSSSLEEEVPLFYGQ